jgi:hypothetical protein
VLADVGGMRWGEFKPHFADAVIAHLGPIQARYAEVMDDPAMLDQILAMVRVVVVCGCGWRRGGGGGGWGHQCLHV